MDRELEMKQLGQFTVYVLLIVMGFIAFTLLGERNNWRQTVTEAQATADLSVTRQYTTEMELVVAQATAVALESQFDTVNKELNAVAAETQAQLLEAQNDAQAAVNQQSTLETELTTQQQTNLAYRLALASEQIREGFQPDIEYSVLLAIEAARRHPDTNTYRILQQGLELLPQFQMQMASHPNGNSIRFSEDGRFLLTGGGQATIEVWDLATGYRIAQRPHRRIYDWSVDGRYLAIDGWPDESYIFDTTSQKIVFTLPYPTFGLAAAFSEDNHLVAYSTDVVAGVNPVDGHSEYDYIFVVQNIQSGNEILREVLNPVRENSVASYEKITFSSDNRYVAGANYGRIDIWNLETGQIEIEFPIEVGWPENLLFSPDNAYLAIAGIDGMMLWDVIRNKEIPISHTSGTVQSVRFSHDNQYLVTTRKERRDGGEGGSWYEGQSGTWVWATDTGTEALSLTEMDQDASFIADTHQIVVINQAGHMQFWDIDSKRLLAQSQLTEHQFSRINPTGSLIASINPQERIDLWSIEPFLTTQILYPMTLIRSNYRVPDNLANLAYSPDGTQFVTHSWDGQVRLWDSANGRELQNFTSQDTINVLAFSPDGEELAIGGSNYPSPAPSWLSYGLTDIWHGSQGTTITLTHEHDVNDIAFSPDGRFFATATNITQLWDAASGTKIITCAPDLMPLNLIFTPDGNHLIILTRDKVVICNLQTGEITQTLLPQENNEFWKMALHPNGRILAVAENTTVDIWELDTNIVLTTLTASEVKYQSELIFSPDGRYLANFTKWTNPINDINPNLDIWDTQDWHPIINERMPQVNAFAFSPDGNYMALGDNNGLIRILSLPDGHEFSQLQYDESIKQIAFRPNGQQIAALGWETALLWQWNPIDWFSETCQRLSRNLTHAEWQEYFGNEPYQATCSNLSVP